MPKSLHTPVALFGIMKAGAAYVPIDPAAPLARLAWQLEDCAITHLVISAASVKSLRQLCAEHTAPQCLVGMEPCDGISSKSLSWHDVAARGEALASDGLALPRVMEDDLAYIIYTSGSTGTPKGIMHTHRSGMAYARLSASTYGVRPGDRLGNHSPLHFDISTFDYFTGPLCGATTVIIPEAVTRLPASMSALIEAERLTIWYSVSSALGQLLNRGVMEQRRLDSLRWVIFGGDLLSPDQLRGLAALLPDARFSNSYGPAEVNQCTYYHVPPEGYTADAPLPIGRVWDNTDGLVLDTDDAPVPHGETGELVIRSATMMLGYWNRPDLNERAFYYRPALLHYADRFYRTGDLVRLREDGELEFHGRKDRQVKTRGYRVELDEIETAMSMHADIDEAAAVPLPDPDIGLRIEAAVTVLPGSVASAKSLRRHLRATLPPYAVPARIEFVSELPRTPTGKVDRVALREQLAATAQERPEATIGT